MNPPDPGAPDAARLRFEAVFREHYVAILAFALPRVSDRGAAEDAAAETFAVAWRRRAEVPEPPLPWLYAAGEMVNPDGTGYKLEPAWAVMLECRSRIRKVPFSGH